MTYVIVEIALVFATGIALGSVMRLPALLLWGISAAITAAAWSLHRLPRPVRMSGFLIAVLMLGLLRGAHTPQFPEWLIRRTPAIREVTGMVIGHPEFSMDSMSFIVRPDHLPGDLLVDWTCDQSLGRLTVGDRIVARGRTELPEAFEGFDYPAYLQRRGIFATLFADDVIRLEGAKRWSVRAWGDGVRQRSLTRLRQLMSPTDAALAQSLMFGDRSALPDAINDAFSRTGLMHLLAVSGLHLGIFLGGAWWLLRRLGLRPRLAYPVVGVLVGLALIVIGPRVSLIRASLLFAFLGLGSVLADFGVILRKWIHPLNGLAASAIALLMIRPGHLFDVGFQLTMAATGSILIAFSPSGWGTRYLHSDRVTRMRKIWQWLVQLLVVSAAAQAGAAPIIAWHFQALHPLSLLFNVIAVPLAGLSLWAGLAALPLLATSVSAVTLAPFIACLRVLAWLVSVVARIPCAELPVRPLTGLWMAGCVGFIYLVAYRKLLECRSC